MPKATQSASPISDCVAKRTFSQDSREISTFIPQQNLVPELQHRTTMPQDMPSLPILILKAIEILIIPRIPQAEPGTLASYWEEGDEEADKDVSGLFSRAN